MSVDAVTYDSVIKEKADLVKIDVEGAEFLVLEGMKDSLKKRQVECLMVELHNVDEGKRLLESVKNYGFDITWIDPIHLLATL